MNQILVLSNFLIMVAGDPRIGPLHISLYAGLLKLWGEQAYKNPFAISRRQLMPLCKINGLATYHGKIKELHEYGYIQYEPSYNPYEGSQVLLKTI